ncbi:hypothetical protein SAMN05421819_2656 [Bryocella elongata]|uniref:Uncharacterized protein n=1 Tax=Bryocella elongata TaxID=863522 RepID=A0A1H5ZH02_9BACT|nr:hypothetical protein [Bryocella elongata]SEG35739.1 hypothetical protein SAMN05421819_2656 [Bryocella elongata]
MSDLNLGPPEQPSRAKYFVSAIIVIAVIVAAVVWFNPHHISEISIERTEVFAPHTVSKTSGIRSGGMHVIGETEFAEDNLYLIATVRFKDTLRIPLDPMGGSATLITPENESVDGTLVALRDLPRLTQIFPNLAPLTGKPLSLDPFQPGEAREGTLVFLFSGIAEKDWKSKKSATITIRLSEQPAQTIPL